MLSSGCTTGLGPWALRTDRPDYNQQIVRSADSEMLLNIVRLRYDDTPLFLELGAVVSQYGISASLNGTGHVDAASGNGDASAEESSVCKALARIPVLQGLPEEVVLELSASGALRRFARDEIVFREGDRGTTMYIVTSGDVLLTTPDQKGVEREVMRLSPGDFIGLSQVVLRQPNSVCARATTDLTLVAIPGEAASRLLNRSPRLASDLGEAQEARRKATLQAKQGHTNAVG